MHTRLAYWFIDLSKQNKLIILISTDVFVIVTSLWMAFSLRWGELYIPKNHEWYLFAVAPIIAIPIFARFGLYRAIIRFLEMKALWTIIQASSIYALIFAFILYESGIKVIPRTVPPLNWLIVMLLVGCIRFFARWWLGETYFQLRGGRKEPQLLK